MRTDALTELVNAVIQVLLFTFIPFVVWLIAARKKESFFSWIGFKKIHSDKKKCLIAAIVAFLICEVIGFVINNTIMKADWNQSAFAGMGAAGLPSIFLFSYVQTALSEEILYRGFIQKRIQGIFGFKTATFIQALIFGITHVVLTMGQITVAQGIALLLYPMIPGVLIAYVNEKKADGSIIPGLIIHGTLNFLVHLAQLW